MPCHNSVTPVKKLCISQVKNRRVTTSARKPFKCSENLKHVQRAPSNYQLKCEINAVNVVTLSVILSVPFFLKKLRLSSLLLTKQSVETDSEPRGHRSQPD